MAFSVPSGNFFTSVYGVSRSPAFGSVYRLGGSAYVISTFAPSRLSAFSASSRVRSYMASTNGVDQWAECNAIRDNVPSLMRWISGWAILGVISA